MLRRRYILGMKDAEIAEDLGYRASGISKLVLRCMAALLREITREPDSESESSRDGGSPP